MPDTITLPAPSNLPDIANEESGPRYAGKAKRLWATDTPGELLVEYTDQATAFNGDKRARILGKGVVNNEVSATLMEMLAERGIPTHLVREVSASCQLVREVSIVPLEVIVRNRAWGSLVRRTGIHQGLVLDPPVVEFSLKDDELGDPLVNRDHIRVLGIADAARVDALAALALQVNAILCEHLEGLGLELVDAKYEFGIDAGGQLLLADEISPDTCRLHDTRSGQQLDKDRFRNDMGGVSAAYDEVHARICAGRVPAATGEVQA